MVFLSHSEEELMKEWFNVFAESTELKGKEKSDAPGAS